jgi:HSP20 family protein
MAMLFRRIPGWTSSVRNPFDDLERMQRQMDWLMGSLGRGASLEPGAGVFPLMNVSEDKDHYYVRAELPGIEAQNLDISVAGDSLSISGERKIDDGGGDARYHRRERTSGTFSRVLTLPSKVDAEKAEAKSVNGVLTIVISKAQETKPKQISVKVG